MVVVLQICIDGDVGVDLADGDVGQGERNWCSWNRRKVRGPWTGGVGGGGERDGRRKAREGERGKRIKKIKEK